MTNKEARVTLDLSDDYTIEELKANYRKKCKQYHPDINSNQQFAEKMMKSINEAYEILKNEIKDTYIKTEFDLYKEEIYMEIYNQQRQNQQNYNRTSSISHEYVIHYQSYCYKEGNLYNSTLSEINYAITKEEIDKIIDEFNYRRHNLISEFTDKIFLLWEKNLYIQGFVVELKKIYDQEKENIKRKKTIDEVYQSFESTKKNIEKESSRISKQVNDSLKIMINTVSIKYENYAYYEVLKDSIDAIKNQVFKKCLSIRTSLGYYNNPTEKEKEIRLIVNSIENNCDELFNQFQIFLQRKNDKIKTIIELGNDYLNDKNSIIIKLIDKYLEILNNIYNEEVFNHKYNDAVKVITKNINEYEAFRKKETLEKKLSRVQEKLNERFKKIPLINLKNTEILYLSLNVLNGIREGNIHEVKLSCLLGISFINYEHDLEIIKTVYEEEVALKINQKQENEKIIDFGKNRVYRSRVKEN